MTKSQISKVKNLFFRFVERNSAFLKKLGVSLVTLVMATILIFFILRLIPGDIIYEYAIKLANERGISFEEARRQAILILNYDPDAPLYTQFFTYMQGLLRGELGQSLYSDSISANLIIKEMLPWTLFIASTSLGISFLLGTLLGSVMARKRGTKTDTAISSYVIVSGAIPDYLMGLLLLTWFAFGWGIFPAGGNYDIYVEPGFNLDFILSVVYYATLPILAFVLVHTGSWTLLMRGSSVGVLGEDYIYAAKARGLSEKTIIKKYLRRNALLPLITSLAISFAVLFGGSALMESIFNYPGLGKALSERIAMKDYFVVQGLMFFSSAMMIFVNLLTDSIYSLIDPRVRRGGE